MAHGDTGQIQSRHMIILAGRSVTRNVQKKQYEGESWEDISIQQKMMIMSAKAIVAKAKEAGVVMTPAGATFPYGKDPQDSNIRIAPSFPTTEDLAAAADLFVLCVKLVSVEKLLETK